jgi:hypothetical protein
MVHQFSAKTQNVSDKGSFSEDADGREYPLSTHSSGGSGIMPNDGAPPEDDTDAA